MSTPQSQIEVGTMVSSILYNRGQGYVTAVRGRQAPETVRSHLGGACVSGGRAQFDIVFASGSYSLGLPEAILRGVQWTVHSRAEGFADQAMLDRLCRQADTARAQAKADAAAAEAAFAEAVDALRADPAHAGLTQGDTGDGALAAKNIRVLLRQAFPGVKFSVRKRHYGALDVTWSGAPGVEAVEIITSRFKSGHYDAHEDLHRSRSTPWMKVFGHADYITTSRA